MMTLCTEINCQYAASAYLKFNISFILQKKCRLMTKKCKVQKVGKWKEILDSV